MSEHVRSNSKAKSGQACVVIPITLLHAIKHLMGTYLINFTCVRDKGQG